MDSKGVIGWEPDNRNSLTLLLKVTIFIYDVRGQLIRTLNLGGKAAGSYLTKEKAAHWDGCNELGEKVSSGVYFYTIRAGEYKETRKMLLNK